MLLCDSLFALLREVADFRFVAASRVARKLRFRGAFWGLAYGLATIRTQEHPPNQTVLLSSNPLWGGKLSVLRNGFELCWVESFREGLAELLADYGGGIRGSQSLL